MVVSAPTRLDFDQSLEQKVHGYTGPHSDLVVLAPRMFRLLVGLLDDPQLPTSLRPMVLSAIAYFIIPSDVIPEDIYGPTGFLDDIYLACYVANHVATAVDEGILLRNWRGKEDIRQVISDVLRRAEEYLIGVDGMSPREVREAILTYVGVPAGKSA